MNFISHGFYDLILPFFVFLLLSVLFICPMAFSLILVIKSSSNYLNFKKVKFLIPYIIIHFIICNFFVIFISQSYPYIAKNSLDFWCLKYDKYEYYNNLHLSLKLSVAVLLKVLDDIVPLVERRFVLRSMYIYF